ncbi:threonine--tRNA ligase [Neglectibacter caecimuris]|uniref:threonine--tRNA ligase n=1 Tax=Neglectibacter caecimuris TaxID=3093658 RepID=UPI002AC9B68E|nr:threonine--tRNA ligase [Neglectibacter sp. M00184]
MIKIDLKGQRKEFESGVTPAEVAKSIGMGLFKAACAARVDGEGKDLRTPLTQDCALEILTFDEAEGKHAYWHTTAHIMAQAVNRLYPGTKFAIGPAIENGFYYDFDMDTPLSSEELPKIEEEMKKIIKENLELEKFELPAEEAKREMAGQEYKEELIDEHSGNGEKISFYRQGDFTDLCAGPHLMSTGGVKAVKLTSITGAYWRGDATKKMLTRVYGISFPKQSQLDEYLQMLEEAKKRDHRKLGKELGLFMLRDEGPGFPFFLPKGMVLKNTLIDYWRQVHKKYGYLEISTPIMLNRQLWERSGHWEHYKDNMYTTVIDETNFGIKPMNCPGGMLVYASEPHSYRELPLRVGELGLVHRHELSGTLHGLFRVRCFTQDDAHIFMTREQMQEVIQETVGLFDEVYSTFGLSYTIELSTMPEDHIGEVEEWERNQEILKSAITAMGKDYVINEGDGAFYGPKLDFHIADSLGRTWQCGTIQLDSQLPERFELEYVGADGEKHRPVMIHRVVLGSIERFIGVITEHFAGKFPLWLSPVQAVILPISERHHEYAQSLKAQLEAAGLRVECDTRNEKIGYKIREAQLQQTPYMLVVGDKEAESSTISPRHRKDGDLGAMSVEEFIAKTQAEIASREIK